MAGSQSTSRFWHYNEAEHIARHGSSPLNQLHDDPIVGLLDLLKEMNARDKYPVIVGGGVITQKWADEEGAEDILKVA